MANDRLHLERFIKAQEDVYEHALQEIRNGKKETHWMWFIFPQLHGLGRSQMSDYYGLHGKEEARAYLAHPLLGQRLREITEVVLSLNNRSVNEIFGHPDNQKFESSMRLFASVDASPGSVFERALKTLF